MYTSHLEDLEGLLAQRVELFHDHEVPWPCVADFEERIEAHLSGLLLQGSRSFPTLHEMVESGEADLVRAAAYVLGQYADGEALEPVWEVAENGDDESITAVGYALRYVDNALVRSRLQSFLSHQSIETRVMAVETLGYRRELTVESLVPLLLDDETAIAASAAFAARRKFDKALIAPLDAALINAEPVSATEIAFTLTLLGQHSGREWLSQSDFYTGNNSENTMFYAGLLGFIHEHTFESPEGIRGAGYWGTVDSGGGVVSRLLSVIEEDNTTENIEASAGSLHIVFGDGPVEERVEIDEWIDPDGELVEREETLVIGPSRSAEVWKSWIAKNASLSSATGRHRRGRPLTSSVLLEEIADENSHYECRQVAYWELLMGGYVTEPFEPDWPVRQQRATISAWRSKSSL